MNHFILGTFICFLKFAHIIKTVVFHTSISLTSILEIKSRFGSILFLDGHLTLLGCSAVLVKIKRGIVILAPARINPLKTIYRHTQRIEQIFFIIDADKIGGCCLSLLRTGLRNAILTKIEPLNIIFISANTFRWLSGIPASHCLSVLTIKMISGNVIPAASRQIYPASLHSAIRIEAIICAVNSLLRITIDCVAVRNILLTAGIEIIPLLAFQFVKWIYVIILSIRRI